MGHDATMGPGQVSTRRPTEKPCRTGRGSPDEENGHAGRASRDEVLLAYMFVATAAPPVERRERNPEGPVMAGRASVRDTQLTPLRGRALGSPIFGYIPSSL